MSFGVLNGKGGSYELKHDLEAFIYIILYCALGWLPVTSKRPLKWWSAGFFAAGSPPGPDCSACKQHNAATREFTRGLNPKRVPRFWTGCARRWTFTTKRVQTHCGTMGKRWVICGGENSRVTYPTGTVKRARPLVSEMYLARPLLPGPRFDFARMASVIPIHPPVRNADVHPVTVTPGVRLEKGQSLAGKTMNLQRPPSPIVEGHRSNVWDRRRPNCHPLRAGKVLSFAFSFVRLSPLSRRNNWCGCLLLFHIRLYQLECKALQWRPTQPMSFKLVESGVAVATAVALACFCKTFEGVGRVTMGSAGPTNYVSH